MDPHRSRLRQFLAPAPTPAFFVRAACVAVGAYLFFGHVLTPFVIRGHSMEPTYRDGGFDFIVKPRFLFSAPRRGDVVVVRLAGSRVLLLKRVVALEGDVVEFRDGTLYLNGGSVKEPYVQGPCRWDLAPRTVGPHHLYVVGDNRSMPMEEHDFGETYERRVAGAPLW